MTPSEDLEVFVLQEQSILRAALYGRRDPEQRALARDQVKVLRDLNARLQAAYERERAEDSARYSVLSGEREELLAEYIDAESARFGARGTRNEGDAEGRFARADAALSSWQDSPDGEEWKLLQANLKAEAP